MFNCFRYFVTSTRNFTSFYINKHEKQPKSCESNIDEKPEGNRPRVFFDLYVQLLIRL